jgi:hypothetical protein
MERREREVEMGTVFRVLFSVSFVPTLWFVDGEEKTVSVSRELAISFENVRQDHTYCTFREAEAGGGLNNFIGFVLLLLVQTYSRVTSLKYSTHRYLIYVSVGIKNITEVVFADTTFFLKSRINSIFEADLLHSDRGAQEIPSSCAPPTEVRVQQTCSRGI